MTASVKDVTCTKSKTHYSCLLRAQILDSYMHLKTPLRKEIIVLF